MIEPMTLTRPPRSRKEKTSMTLETSDIETVKRFQAIWKYESFSEALRRVIREYAELTETEAAA